jgi:ankyrin repeat protein
MVRKMVELGAKVNAINSDRWTSLFDTLQVKHDNIIVFLLEKSHNPVWKEWSGIAPLHLAIRSSHLNSVRLLLEYKANPHIQLSFDRPMAPIYMVALEGNYAAARPLLEKGADRTCKDYLGRTPMDIAGFRDP